MEQPEMVSPQMGMDVTDDDKLWALLSWIFTPLIPVVVLFMEDKKSRQFIKYNAMQALVLGVLMIVSSALTAVVIGCVTTPLLLIYIIILAVKSYKGEWVTIPVVTDFCKGQGWI